MAVECYGRRYSPVNDSNGAMEEINLVECSNGVMVKYSLVDGSNGVMEDGNVYKMAVIGLWKRIKYSRWQ